MKVCRVCGKAEDEVKIGAHHRDCNRCRGLREREQREAPAPITYAEALISAKASSTPILLARAEFLSNPASLQEERRERVRHLLLQERLRGQLSPSYLRQHAREIYGI